MNTFVPFVSSTPPPFDEYPDDDFNDFKSADFSDFKINHSFENDLICPTDNCLKTDKVDKASSIDIETDDLPQNIIELNNIKDILNDSGKDAINSVQFNNSFSKNASYSKKNLNPIKLKDESSDSCISKSNDLDCVNNCSIIIEYNTDSFNSEFTDVSKNQDDNESIISDFNTLNSNKNLANSKNKDSDQVETQNSSSNSFCDKLEDKCSHMEATQSSTKIVLNNHIDHLNTEIKTYNKFDYPNDGIYNLENEATIDHETEVITEPGNMCQMASATDSAYNLEEGIDIIECAAKVFNDNADENCEQITIDETSGASSNIDVIATIGSSIDTDCDPNISSNTSNDKGDYLSTDRIFPQLSFDESVNNDEDINIKCKSINEDVINENKCSDNDDINDDEADDWVGFDSGVNNYLNQNSDTGAVFIKSDTNVNTEKVENKETEEDDWSDFNDRHKSNNMIGLENNYNNIAENLNRNDKTNFNDQNKLSDVIGSLSNDYNTSENNEDDWTDFNSDQKLSNPIGRSIDSKNSIGQINEEILEDEWAEFDSSSFVNCSTVIKPSTKHSNISQSAQQMLNSADVLDACFPTIAPPQRSHTTDLYLMLHNNNKDDASPPNDDNRTSYYGYNNLNMDVNSINREECLTDRDYESSDMNSEGKIEFDLMDRACRLWTKLENIEETPALAMKWIDSAIRLTYFKSVNIDVNNIISLSLKKSLPAFAINLGLLEPKKLGNVNTNNLQSDADKSPKNDDTSTHFDWKNSGLKNPLEVSQSELEMLESLGGNIGSTNLSAINNGLSPTQASIVDKSTTSTVVGNRQGNVINGKTFDSGNITAGTAIGGKAGKILASMKANGSAVGVAAARTLSLEAESVLAELPDLSFMSSKVLMFPMWQQQQQQQLRRSSTAE